MKSFYRLACVAAVLAFSAGISFAGPIVLCTGAQSGVYYDAGQQIAKMAGGATKVKIVETAGTIENMQRVLDLPVDDPNACDAMIGQPDGPVFLARQSPAKVKMLKPAGKLHREYLQVICSKKSGVDDLGDIAGGKYTLAIGEPGSGAWLIWQNIVEQDSSYADVPVTNDTGSVALAAVADNTTSCMLVAAGLHNGTVNEADATYADDVALVSADDKDFNDAVDIAGSPLYTYDFAIPSGTYPHLQSGFFGSKVSTISWSASVYVNTAKLTDKKAFQDFVQAVGRASLGIKAEYGK